MGRPLRVAFAGTPQFAVPTLEALHDSCHEVVAVFTQPDRPAGRGKRMQSSPVKLFAVAEGLPVYQPEKVGEAEALQLKRCGVDVLIVAAYGQIVPQSVLDAPCFACINVHASLLPRWRGASPVVQALLAGDEKTGVSIMQMEAGLDTGPVLLSSTCSLATGDTQDLVTQRLALMGAEAIGLVLDDLPGYLSAAIPQPSDGVTYAHKVDKRDAEINWSLPMCEIEQHVRAYHSMPMAYAFYKGIRVRVLSASVARGASSKDVAFGTVIDVSASGVSVACNGGAVALTKIQFPGERAMAVSDHLDRVSGCFLLGSRFDLRVG